MALQITSADALKMLNDVHTARLDANAKLQQIEHLQQDLLAQGWQGTSASSYGRRSEQQHEDFQKISQILNAAADKGENHLKSFINADNG